MRLNLINAAAAAMTIACPALGFAADEPAAPPSTAPAVAAPPAAPATPSLPRIAGGPDLYETAKAAGNFTILVKALDATNLKGIVKAHGDITLFAPTDDAFKALPPDQLAKLMAPQNANQLQQILIYHLIGRAVDSSVIKGAKGDVATIEKSTVTLDGSNPVLMVNNANIIETDVRAANGGVMQVIDKVLVPPDSPYAAALAPPPAPPAASAAPVPAPSNGG
jgi:uncharacterized surface protein with fasciclin (FAS1) repeats